MDNDKNEEMLLDAEEDGVSNCCSATVYNGMCSSCKEHCGVVNEDEE